MTNQIELVTFLTLAIVCTAMAVVPNANAVPYAQAAATTVTRQTGGLSSLLGLGGIGSSIPGVISAALPFVLMMGLGAVILPLIGSAFFFREGQKRGLPSISPAFVDGVADVLEKVMKALDAVEKKY